MKCHERMFSTGIQRNGVVHVVPDPKQTLTLEEREKAHRGNLRRHAMTELRGAVRTLRDVAADLEKLNLRGALFNLTEAEGVLSKAAYRYLRERSCSATVSVDVDMAERGRPSHVRERERETGG